ncbi:hypothetical protein C874_05325 [Elizabethkingia anophelis 502]|nr:hypothetical protein C874_05325 [Elizabethkingia anophelis 502]
MFPEEIKIIFKNFKVKQILYSSSIQRPLLLNFKIKKMKNKMRYILPKLIGITVIAGLAILIIGMVFKLLLAVTLIAGIGTLVASKFRRRRERYFEPYQENLPIGFNPSNNSEFAVRPNYRNSRTENIAIIPIN